MSGTTRPKRIAEGPRWRRLVPQIVNRDKGRCHICNHYGACSADHVVPETEDPNLAWEPTNLKAAHGYPKGCGICSKAAGKPIYCNEIRGMGSIARARRLIEERTGLRLDDGTPFQPEGRLLCCYLLFPVTYRRVSAASRLVLGVPLLPHGKLCPPPHLEGCLAGGVLHVGRRWHTI